MAKHRSWLMPLLLLVPFSISAQHVNKPRSSKETAQLRALERSVVGPTLGSVLKNRVEIKSGHAAKAPLATALKNLRFLSLTAGDANVRATAKRYLADLLMELTEIRLAQEGDKGIEAIQGVNTALLEEALKGFNQGYGDAIRLYNQILQVNPNYPDKLHVLYQLARANDLHGELEEEVKVLNRLVKEYPASPYHAEVQFRRGELYFDLKEYRRSAQAYNEVLNGEKKSTFYSKALYKHGWASFKTADYELARSSFFTLLDSVAHLGLNDPQVQKAELQLLEDTYRVLSLSFAYQDGAKTITKSLAKLGHRPYAALLYRQLGELYLKQERFTDAANNYKHVLALKAFKGHIESHHFQAGIVRAYRLGRFKDKVRPEMERYVNGYGVNSKFWSANPTAQAAVLENLEEYLPKLAKYHHASAQKRKRRSDYRVAAKWYREYLQSFPRAENAAELNFLLAESLYEARDYVAAAKEYEATAYSYLKFEKRAEAGYAALLAYQKRAPNIKDERQQSEVRRLAVASGLRFAETYNEDKRLTDVLIRVAEEQLSLKLPGDAASTAQRVLKSKPNNKIRGRAWIVLAYGSFDSGNYAEAEKGFREALRNTAKRDKDYPTYRERLAAAIYRQGEAQRDSGNLKVALEDFRRTLKSVPETKFRVNVEFDIATALIEMKAWDDAVVALESFTKDHPGHKLQITMPEKLAVAYEGAGKFSLAASQLEKIAAREKSSELGRESLWRAAELHEKGEKYPSAIAAYKRFVRGFPKPLEMAMEGRNKLVALYAKSGDEQKRLFWLRDIVKVEKKTTTGSTQRTKFLAAGASFELAELAANEFRSVRLALPLQKSLARKQKAMQRAIGSYSTASEFGVAKFTTAATFRIAEIYQLLGSDILASARPKGLSEMELEQYDILLEEQAFPFEEKAIEIFEINTGRIGEGVYDEWTKRTLQSLAAILPGRYAKREGIADVYEMVE